MIRELVVAIPQQEVPRTPEMQRFADATGIAHTWRTELPTTELALSAAREISPQGIRQVVCVTQSPDRTCPPMAYAVAEALELPSNIPLLDVQHACAGFVYAVWLARKFGNRTLIVLADRLRMRQDQPEMSHLLFSDAAAAVVFDACPADTTRFHNDPQGQAQLINTTEGMHMDGGAVTDFVLSTVPPLVRSYCEDLARKPELLVQHQANLQIMRTVARRSRFEDRSVEAIQEWGNMSMVSIPCALAARENRVLGKRLLLCGYGAGWSAAVTTMRYADNPVARVIRV